MSVRITKLQRWIDVIAYLVGRRVPVPWEELLAHVPAYAQNWDAEDAKSQATVRRMFERDKDELRAHGIPLQTVRYSINFGKEQIDGYRIARRDFYLPYLRLIDQVRGTKPTAGHGRATHRSQTIEEIELAREDRDLALEALRRVADVPSFPLVREARSAFRKLAFGLEAEAFPVGAPVLFVERPGSEELLVNLRTVSTALLAKKRLTFRYNGIYRNTRTDRTVEPFGLLFHHGHWYLIGHDSGRGAIRVFRADRMEAVQVNRKSANTPDYEVPQDFRLNAYANREPWELGGEEDEAPIVARVLVRWPASLGMDRNRQGTLEDTLPDGSAVRRFTIYQAHPFLRWMLSLEADAQILEPRELAQALQGMAREVASIHAPSAALDGKAGDP